MLIRVDYDGASKYLTEAQADNDADMPFRIWNYNCLKHCRPGQRRNI